MAHPKLSVNRIIDAAQAVIEARGLTGFSMRTLAVELGVDPMAVYHYFPNKDALVQGVLKKVMSYIDTTVPGVDWQQDLAILCNNMRRFALNHPQIIVIYCENNLWLLPEHRFFEALYRVFRDSGMEKRHMAMSLRLTMKVLEEFCYCEGMGWHEPEDEKQYVDSLEGEPFPLLREMMPETLVFDSDQDFNFSVAVLTQGLASFCKQGAGN